MQGCFQFEDIRKAKEIAKNFYIEMDIQDVNEYLLAIENVYTYAVDFNDTRCQGEWLNQKMQIVHMAYLVNTIILLKYRMIYGEIL